jgi:riboflavin kinase/FMN adenylyltransferase
MLTYRDRLPEDSIEKAVVSIGVFDGVHAGHAVILEKMFEVSRQQGGQSVVITFSNHPRCVTDRNFTCRMLTTESEKIQLLEQMKVDVTVLLHFTQALAQMSYIDFLMWIQRKIHIHTLVLGYNHCFGKNREGNIDNIAQIVPQYGFDLIVIEEQYWQDVPVSSSRIRQAVAEGDYKLANGMLGRLQFREQKSQTEKIYAQRSICTH